MCDAEGNWDGGGLSINQWTTSKLPVRKIWYSMYQYTNRILMIKHKTSSDLLAQQTDWQSKSCMFWALELGSIHVKQKELCILETLSSEWSASILSFSLHSVLSEVCSRWSFGDARVRKTLMFHGQSHQAINDPCFFLKSWFPDWCSWYKSIGAFLPRENAKHNCHKLLFEPGPKTKY